MVDTVAPRPVLAAGGIADGRGLVAALALGAAGVWMGTRFIATVEAHGHDNYKRRIVDLDEEGTVISRASSGKPCRLIRNDFTREWDRRLAEIEPFPVQYERVGKPASIRAREQGDVEHGSAACGQSAALVHGVATARAVIDAIVAEAASTLRGLGAGHE
jgi:enoyl-[acyl-carrier protein] reductase II